MIYGFDMRSGVNVSGVTARRSRKPSAVTSYLQHLVTLTSLVGKLDTYREEKVPHTIKLSYVERTANLFASCTKKYRNSELLTVKRARGTFKAMITGFNTDVQHQEQVYHVQTEDRGTRENPVLESLVYIGGTIIAKKLTPYADKLNEGATEATIASLLKRQHQVIIAAIKAGRIEDLIKHSAKYSENQEPLLSSPSAPSTKAGKAQREGHAAAEESKPHKKSSKSAPLADPTSTVPAKPVEVKRRTLKLSSTSRPVFKVVEEAVKVEKVTKVKDSKPLVRNSKSLVRDSKSLNPAFAAANAPTPTIVNPINTSELRTGSLNLDDVISEYIKRSSEQERLDIQVIAPSVFIAGKSITLRIEVKQKGKIEPDAIVTVKVIGTAFKPQVYIGRAGDEGIVAFNLTLPSFTSGTAAIVIEAQSRFGRGELKQLIRKA